MKFDRRLFLKALSFAGGGMLGFLCSPAPWHMIRDLARWTQNWPWVPIPPHGEPSVQKSICGMCDGGCGISVRKVGDRLVSITGNAGHPINRGLICPLGIAGLQMVYGPSRVTQPMRRTGSRQNPKWEPVTWEAAITEVAGKVQELRDAHESHSLACITSAADSTNNLLFERFLQAVGSRNFVKMNSGKDFRRIALELMQGVEGELAYDLENAGFILSFGCSLLEGWGACGRMYSAYGKWFDEEGKSQFDLIQVEPNLSPTAAKASHWVPLKPGTEAALALGIAHVLIRDKLYDKNFVDTYCSGFDDWADDDGKKHKGFKSLVFARYSPSSVERITSVPEKEIKHIAYRFAENEFSLAIGGKGRGERFENIYELMAVHSLNALVGNIGRKGGTLVKPDAPLAPLPPIVMDEEARRGYAVERLDEAGGEKFPFSTSLPGNLKADEIKVLFVHDTNPRYALPDQEAARRIFETVPYIVSFSTCMDESASEADLILPLPSRLERWDDLLAAPELPYPVYSLTQPLIEPIYETQNAGDILMKIAKELGTTIAESLPWNSVKETLELRTRGLFEANRGIISSPAALARIEEGLDVSPEYSSFAAMWEKLLEDTCWCDPDNEHGAPEKLMQELNGKFEFFSSRLLNAFEFSDEIKYMPHYEEMPPIEKGFDLLIMPEDMLIMADDGKYTPPFSIKQLSPKVIKGRDLFVRINPRTAMYRGLKEEDEVILESPKGKVKVRLHVFEGIRDGVVLIPLGFGHTAYDDFLGNKGVNANEVIEAKKDSVTGLPVWGIGPGRITKV